MAIPLRGQTSHSTYFITADCWEKKRVLQSDRACELLLDVLYHYRAQQKYLLHEFVIMPHHIHLLLTPADVTLERSMQLIKGGFSYRAGKELGTRGEIWQTSFVDRRVRDGEEYVRFRDYIHQNPVAARMVSSASEFRFSSAHPSHLLDPVPQRLKPQFVGAGMQA